MVPEIHEKQAAIAALCRHYGVDRLEVFGSAARGEGFDTAGSDVDFLVTFAPARRNDLTRLLDLQEALERLLGKPVDLIEREAVEASANYIRRRAILKQARTVYG